ncbi:unnamed protein product, partial [Staurois parvus]
MYTDHQGTDDQCALMIRVAPAAPPVSASSMPHQCLPVHISATYQCPSELPFSVTYQCQSVPPISATNQCRLSVPISTTYQCQSVPPISGHQCCLSVPSV